MRKTILLLLLAVGLTPLQADEYEYLWLHSPAASGTRSFAISDLRKITFGSDAISVYLHSLTSPVNWAYANLLKITFEAKAAPTAVESLSAASDLSITRSMSAVNVESPSPLKSVTIYNLQGSRLALFGQGEKAASYSLTSLPAGIYVIRAENAEHTQTVKFVKH